MALLLSSERVSQSLFKVRDQTLNIWNKKTHATKSPFTPKGFPSLKQSPQHNLSQEMTLHMGWELWLLAAMAGAPGQAASRALPKPSPVPVAR